MPWSSDIAQLTPFLAMDVMERGMQMAAAGADVIQLGVGEPDFDAAPEVVEAAARALRDGQTHYTDSRGLLSLREAIAEDCERRRAVSVDPQQVLVTSGTSPAISMVLKLLLSPGDELILPTPHYPCYVNMATLCGARCVEVPTRAAEGYRIDVDRVREAVGPRTRAIVLASPANPTGAVQPPETVKALADLGVPLLSDEIYDGLLYDGATHHSPLGLGGDCFVFDGFSKRHAMTGFRLGYVIAPTAALRPLQSMQQNLHISAAHFVQTAGLAALQQGAEHAAHMRDVYARRRRVLVDGLRELGFVIEADPMGAFYALARAPMLDGDSVKAALHLLEHAQVAAAPGRDFGKAAEGHLRFTYAASEAQIQRALERLRNYLSQHC